MEDSEISNCIPSAEFLIMVLVTLLCYKRYILPAEEPAWCFNNYMVGAFSINVSGKTEEKHKSIFPLRSRKVDLTEVFQF